MQGQGALTLNEGQGAFILHRWALQKVPDTGATGDGLAESGAVLGGLGEP